MSKTNEKTRKCDFSCLAPGAETVFLAGTFNDWKVGATSMKRNSKGEWSASVELTPGRHEFKFVVDGEWVCEPGGQDSAECQKCVPNDRGTMNRFIDVV